MKPIKRRKRLTSAENEIIRQMFIPIMEAAEQFDTDPDGDGSDDSLCYYEITDDSIEFHLRTKTNEEKK